MWRQFKWGSACGGRRWEMCNNVQGRGGMLGVNFGVRVEYLRPLVLYFSFLLLVSLGLKWGTVFYCLDGSYWFFSLHFFW